MKEKIISGGRVLGKQYRMFVDFIKQVKRGEKAVVLGVDYAVVSMNFYKELLASKSPNSREPGTKPPQIRPEFKAKCCGVWKGRGDKYCPKCGKKYENPA